MTIGEKIVKLRKQRDMSQEAFSERLGVSRQAVSKWENNTAQPTNENLAQIAKLFDVSISSLLDDEFVNTSASGTDFTEKTPLSPPDIKKEEKSFRRGVLLQGIAIIILGITNIIQGYMLGGMKNDIAELRRKEIDYSFLQSQINSLQSQIVYIPQTNSEPEFTDYQHKVIKYSRDTNTATVKFSVVPKDYTKDTVAQIVIKSDGHDYSIDATMENNIFTAQADLICDSGMTVYLYLTENEKTRSFVVGYLPNPADNFVMDVYGISTEGKWQAGTGYLDVDITIGCNVDYFLSGDLYSCVYPKKAVINLYCDDQLIYQHPFESIIDNNYIQDAKESADIGADEQAINQVQTTFYQRIKMYLKDEKIRKNGFIWYEIIVTDNNGYEYTASQELIAPADASVSVSTQQTNVVKIDG